jgi:hypothetical protein
MGHAIPKQHPAVVLRSHFNLVRALLGVAMVALVGLAIALVIVASDGEELTGTTSAKSIESINYGGFNPATGRPESAPLPAESAPLPAYPSPEGINPGTGSERSYSGSVPTRKLDGATDGRSTSPVAPGTRYDGGPEEGSRGPLTSPVAPGTRYDGGPEEGSRGPLTSPVAPDTRYDGGPEEGTRGPGFSTD